MDCRTSDGVVDAPVRMPSDPADIGALHCAPDIAHSGGAACTHRETGPRSVRQLRHPG